MPANQSSNGSPWSSSQKAAPPGASGAGGLPAAGGKKRSWLRGGGAEGGVQTFRSPGALVVWIVWLLFAVANWADLAVQGRDHASVVAAALLLLVTGIAYVAAQRPRIVADDAGVTVRNPLRDYRIGWATVTKVDLADLLRVHCDWDPGAAAGKKHSKVISSWAVHYSRRRQFAADARARRGSGPRRSSFGLPYGRSPAFGDTVVSPTRVSPAGANPAGLEGSSPEAEAEMIVRILTERATAAQAEAVWATGSVEIAGAQGTEAAGPPPAVTGWLEPLKSTWSQSALAAVLIPALILLIVCLL